MSKAFEKALVKLAREHNMDVLFECRYCAEKNFSDAGEIHHFVTLVEKDEEGPQE